MLQIDNSKYEDYFGQFDYQIKLQNLVKIFHQKIERQTKSESKYYPKFVSLSYIKPDLISKNVSQIFDEWASIKENFKTISKAQG